MKKKRIKNSPYRRLFECMKPYRVKLIAAVIILLIAVISYSCAPLFMGYATNALTDIFTGASTYKEGHPFLKFLLLTKAVFICIIFILTAFLTLLLHL